MLPSEWTYPHVGIASYGECLDTTTFGESLVEREHNVSIVAVWAVVCWVLAATAVLASATAAIGWSDLDRVRSVALALFGVGVLFAAGAITLSLRVVMCRNTRWLLDQIELQRDVDHRVRQMR